MQLGIHLPHAGSQATPALIRRHARQAEDMGLSDVWVSEHIIVPRAQFPRRMQEVLQVRLARDETEVLRIFRVVADGVRLRERVRLESHAHVAEVPPDLVH